MNSGVTGDPVRPEPFDSQPLPVRPEALEGRTNGLLAQDRPVEGRTADAGPRLDALIDETLQDLTTGVPREGFRGRVMARITATPEPSQVRFIEILGWRVRPFHLATASAVGALILVAFLVVPSLLERRGAKPDVQQAASKPVQSQLARDDAPKEPAGGASVQSASVSSSQPSQNRVPVRQAADVLQARVREDEAGAIPWLRVDPLPDPDPIVNNAIEIKPVEIQQLDIPEIQVRPLDTGRPLRDNRERE